MTFTLTFELWDLPCCALGQTLMTSITGQRHGNTTAAQKESNLLTAGILLHNTGRKREDSHYYVHLENTKPESIFYFRFLLYFSHNLTYTQKRCCWLRSTARCIAATLFIKREEKFYGKSCSTNAGWGKVFKINLQQKSFATAAVITLHPCQPFIGHTTAQSIRHRGSRVDKSYNTNNWVCTNNTFFFRKLCSWWHQEQPNSCNVISWQHFFRHIEPQESSDLFFCSLFKQFFQDMLVAHKQKKLKIQNIVSAVCCNTETSTQTGLKWNTAGVWSWNSLLGTMWKTDVDEPERINISQQLRKKINYLTSQTETNPAEQCQCQTKGNELQSCGDD